MATRINLKFKHYLYLESCGEEKAAHSYINAGKEVKFWWPGHYYVNMILITFIQLEFINVELFCVFLFSFSFPMIQTQTKNKTTQILF